MPVGESGFYEGSALKYRGRKGEPVALKHAILDAYDNAMEGRAEERTDAGALVPYSFRVADIFIDGVNPPTDYRVHLADHP